MLLRRLAFILVGPLVLACSPAESFAVVADGPVLVSAAATLAAAAAEVLELEAAADAAAELATITAPATADAGPAPLELATAPTLPTSDATGAARLSRALAELPDGGHLTPILQPECEGYMESRPDAVRCYGPRVLSDGVHLAALAVVAPSDPGKAHRAGVTTSWRAAKPLEHGAPCSEASPHEHDHGLALRARLTDPGSGAPPRGHLLAPDTSYALSR